GLRPGKGATNPRTSIGYTATFALLQASMTALNSDCLSGVSGKPEVSSTRLLRPGTAARFLARSRTAHNMLRAPNSASALTSGGAPNEATSPFGDTVPN